jgi:hypothetical protein
MPPLYIYFSLYIVIWGFLYWKKIVKYNPYSWLIIAILVSIITILYVIYINAPINMIIKYIIYCSPKLILLCLIDSNNTCDGFMIGAILCILYLIIIDFDLIDIYYNQTIKKIIDSTW